VIGDAENLALMTRIHDKWAISIADACRTSSVPEPFLAALVANETGGDPYGKRFEHGVLASLWEVLQGRKAAYGSIHRDDVVHYIAPASAIVGSLPPSGFASAVTASLQRLDSLASSWGLTQIMGYEAIVFGVTVSDLQVPAYGLKTTLRMLGEFAERYQLDLAKDFSQLLDCWNSGRPHSPTADPAYIPKGLQRMQIYQELLPPKAMSA
jgi:hypothetical protein